VYYLDADLIISEVQNIGSQNCCY